MNTPSDSDLSRLVRFEQLAAADPRNTALLADAFDIALRARAFDFAERFLERERAVDATSPGLLFREARWHLAKGEHGEARALFETVRARTGPQSGVDTHLAAACAAQGDHARCVALLQPYAAQRSLPPGAWSLLIRALHHERQFDTALALVREQREAFAGDAASLGAASLLCLDADDLALAAALAARALELEPQQCEALIVSGFAVLNDSQGERACALFEAAVQVRATEPRAWSGLGFARLLGGESAGATQAFEASLKLSGDHVGTWHGLAWSRLAVNDHKGAEAAFEAALQRDRNFAETHGGLALTAYAQGRREAAQQAVALALRLDRRSPTARYVQALMSGTRLDGNSRAAVEHILEGVRLRNAALPAKALFALARRGEKLDS
jgi:tetratricopeptide (TPR) repeat protein